MDLRYGLVQELARKQAFFPKVHWASRLNNSTETIVSSRWPAWELGSASAQGISGTSPHLGMVEFDVWVNWANLSATAGDVKFSATMLARQGGDGLNAGEPSINASATAAGQSVLNITKVGTLSVGGLLNEPYLIHLRIIREPSDAADTLAGSVSVSRGGSTSQRERRERAAVTLSRGVTVRA